MEKGNKKPQGAGNILWKLLGMPGEYLYFSPIPDFIRYLLAIAIYIVELAIGFGGLFVKLITLPARVLLPIPIPFGLVVNSVEAFFGYWLFGKYGAYESPELVVSGVGSILGFVPGVGEFIDFVEIVYPGILIAAWRHYENRREIEQNLIRRELMVKKYFSWVFGIMVFGFFISLIPGKSSIGFWPSLVVANLVAMVMTTKNLTSLKLKWRLILAGFFTAGAILLKIFSMPQTDPSKLYIKSYEQHILTSEGSKWYSKAYDRDTEDLEELKQQKKTGKLGFWDSLKKSAGRKVEIEQKSVQEIWKERQQEVWDDIANERALEYVKVNDLGPEISKVFQTGGKVEELAKQQADENKKKSKRFWFWVCVVGALMSLIGLVPEWMTPTGIKSRASRPRFKRQSTIPWTTIMAFFQPQNGAPKNTKECNWCHYKGVTEGMLNCPVCNSFLAPTLRTCPTCNEVLKDETADVCSQGHVTTLGVMNAKATCGNPVCSHHNNRWHELDNLAAMSGLAMLLHTAPGRVKEMFEDDEGYEDAYRFFCDNEPETRTEVTLWPVQSDKLIDLINLIGCPSCGTHNWQLSGLEFWLDRGKEIDMKAKVEKGKKVVGTIKKFVLPIIKHWKIK